MNSGYSTGDHAALSVNSHRADFGSDGGRPTGDVLGRFDGHLEPGQHELLHLERLGHDLVSSLHVDRPGALKRTTGGWFRRLRKLVEDVSQSCEATKWALGRHDCL